MIIKELIEELQKFDPEMEVHVGASMNHSGYAAELREVKRYEIHTIEGLIDRGILLSGGFCK